MLLLLVGWPAQSTKITSLQYFCNISRKVWYKHNFLHEDKHQSYLQTDIIVFNGHN